MFKQSLLQYLSFLRFPSIFSSCSNVFLGYVLFAKEFHFSTLCLGLMAAACSILAGMGLNDIADIKVDAKERPTRPLPSKKISLPKAWLTCILLFIISLTLYYNANPQSLIFFSLLWISIISYNFYFKNTRLGFVPMGLCRGFNLLIGMSLAGISFFDLQTLSFSSWIPIFSLTFYVSLITFLAKDEVSGNKPWKVAFFSCGLAIWIILWIIIFSTQTHILSSILGIIVIAWYGFKIKPLLTNLIRKPESSINNQKIIGFYLWLIPLVDCLALIQNNSLLLILFPITCLFLSKYTRQWFHLT